MSDVAAAFILDRLGHHEAIRDGHLAQFRRLAGIAGALGLSTLVDGGREGAFPNLVPILFPRPVGVERLPGGPLVLHKYYAPLRPRPRADTLYARLACFPCHPGVAGVADDELRAAMAALAGEGE
jgi:hypothetical protein